jgi:hypothetical protein
MGIRESVRRLFFLVRITKRSLPSLKDQRVQEEYWRFVLKKVCLGHYFRLRKTKHQYQLSEYWTKYEVDGANANEQQRDVERHSVLILFR